MFDLKLITANQTVSRFHFAVKPRKIHKLTIHALDAGVVLDQVFCK